ncbi:hypothetical protein CYMTET_8734 [Cymbomonas tetramitiformis]|uniref:EGF-like domain-containing protein n=1 Tax=Cymbomonas tetramitiformis TaxID=36881 RepID=A0AAE0GSY4_9CHLO|nr:hypothetical protein CYMTET_8734 [Cymbomonas tetramitiformis]
MCPVSDEEPQIMSNVTLALLEDSGWYLPAYDLGMYQGFGAEAGCEFATAVCNNTDPFNRFFCMGKASQEWVCSWDHREIGRCTNDSLMDGCPYVWPYASHQCFDPADTSDTAVARGQSYGYHSRCLQDDAEAWTMESAADGLTYTWASHGRGCYAVHCTGEGSSATLYVSLSKGSLPCPEGEYVRAADLDSEYVTGILGPCPSAAVLCPSLGCPNECHSQGVCHWGKCYCATGFVGDDCATRGCTDRSCTSAEYCSAVTGLCTSLLPPPPLSPPGPPRPPPPTPPPSWAAWMMLSQISMEDETEASFTESKQDAFVAAIAEVLEVELAIVIFVSTTDRDHQRRRRRRLDSSIEVNVETGVYAASAESAASLATQLQMAVEDGSLGAQLEVSMQFAYVALELLHTELSALHAEPPPPPQPPEAGDDGADTGNGGTVWYLSLAALCVVGVLIVLLIVYCGHPWWAEHARRLWDRITANREKQFMVSMGVTPSMLSPSSPSDASQLLGDRDSCDSRELNPHRASLGMAECNQVISSTAPAQAGPNIMHNPLNPLNAARGPPWTSAQASNSFSTCNPFLDGPRIGRDLSGVCDGAASTIVPPPQAEPRDEEARLAHPKPTADATHQEAMAEPSDQRTVAHSASGGRALSWSKEEASRDAAAVFQRLNQQEEMCQRR